MTATEALVESIQAKIKDEEPNSNPPAQIGQFGQLWASWMAEYHPKLKMEMELNNSFYSKAEQINLLATQRALKLSEQMLEQRTLPESTIERAAEVNSCKMKAAEIVKKDLLEITPFS